MHNDVQPSQSQKFRQGDDVELLEALLDFPEK